ncbi:MAG: sulfatase [Planctomycetaceae bacterium]
MRITPLLFVLLCTLTRPATAVDRPNVVWLVSEDNSVHYLKLYDPHGAETPRVAELAEHGLVFDHAFSNAPVCSVARTTLATGCYAPRIGTQFHRKSVAVPMPDGLAMFPEILRNAGYYTANNNKTDYNAIPGGRVWDDSSRSATWNGRRTGQPFFYMQSFPVCHESSLHFNEQQMLSESTTADPDSAFVAPYHPDTPVFRYTAARYHDRIAQMDQQIGAVVDQLTADGLLEETFIFYFGDHGGVLPGSKGYARECGLHVPLVIRVPDKWAHLVDAGVGSRQTGFVSFIDFAPTVLNLAGISVPDQMDGRPFVGSGITQAELNARDEAFGSADRFDEKYDQVRSLRRGRYEYIRNYQPFNFDGLQNNYRYRMLAWQEWRQMFLAGTLNDAQRRFFLPRPAEQLFDVEADPHEVNDLADDPQHEHVLAELRQRMTEWTKSLPDLSFYPESVLAESAFSDPTTFGQENRQAIAAYVDIADLQLIPFAQAEQRIEAALQSDDPWQRYWGLITCSVHGLQAAKFAKTAGHLAENDPEGLVRVRAAEFLGLISATDPQAVILNALTESDSALEVGLMLNSVVLLRDGRPGYEFRVSPELFSPTVRNDDTVARRLEYLVP